MVNGGICSRKYRVLDFVINVIFALNTNYNYQREIERERDGERDRATPHETYIKQFAGHGPGKLITLFGLGDEKYAFYHFPFWAAKFSFEFYNLIRGGFVSFACEIICLTQSSSLAFSCCFICSFLCSS